MKLEQTVVAALETIRSVAVKHGWTRHDYLASIGVKEFEGYNHGHEVSASVHPWNGERHFILQCSFDSPGSSLVQCLIPKESTEAYIKAKAHQFFAETEAMVQETYSIRLFRKYGKNPDLKPGRYAPQNCPCASAST